MLTTKQRAYLRGLANPLQPILFVGKNGVTESLAAQADEALEARELVKGTVQENCPETAREALQALCAMTGAEPVQHIGRKFVLYRPSRENKTIELI